VMAWCNPYGSENPGGHAYPVGGLISGEVRVTDQWSCDRPAEHRFRWVCDAAGHYGPVVGLCRRHYLEFTGDASVPMALRREVTVCPRCASLAPTPETQPKVRVRLVPVS
jgi:hypothetical protein